MNEYLYLYMPTQAPSATYFPELKREIHSGINYEDILVRPEEYFNVPEIIIPTYPGLHFHPKDNLLEIDMHINQHQVYPTTEELREYIYDYYPQSFFRISIWNWRHHDGSVHRDPTRLDSKIIQDMCANLRLLYKHIAQWSEARFDLPLLGVLAHSSANDIASIRDKAESLRKLEIKDMSSVDVRLVKAFNSFLDPLWKHMRCANLRFTDSSVSDFDRQMFPGLPYRQLSELRLDTVCSASQVVQLLHLCPSLRNAVFKELIGPKPHHATKLVAGANLRHLTLENDNVSFNQCAKNPNKAMIWAVLGKLSTPALKELSLGYEDIWSAPGFNSFITTSNCKLEKLHFLGIKMSDEDLYFALLKNPHLQELTVQGQSPTHRGEHYDILFSNNLLERMTHEGKWNCLCPDLLRLKVTYPSIQESNKFRRMVRCRYPVRLPNIDLIDAWDIHPDDFGALAKLGKNGLLVTFDGCPADWKQFPPRRPQRLMQT